MKLIRSQKNKFTRIYFSFSIILVAIGFSLLAAPGDFVKYVKIEELDFKIPEVVKTSLTPNLKYYSIYSDKFPITYLEFSMYSCEADTANNGIEIPQLLGEVLKFGGSKNLPDEAFNTKLESLGASFSVTSDYDKI